MVFSSYEIMTFWYSKNHIRCLNTHLIEIMNEVATVLEVEVAWAMVLSSYEIMPLCPEYPRIVLEYTFNWNH